jgi:hypothetical protein
MQRLLFLTLLASIAWAQIHVEIRENEVWLIRNGQPKQLTHDGRSKLQVLHSREFNRIGYAEQCTEAENCTPSVIVLDRDGNRLQSFAPRPSALGDPSPCASILNIFWTSGERAIGVECHANPSLSEYVEIDISTGKTLRDLVGIEFTPSPAGDHIACIGPLIHFAPPYRQSNYLRIDGMTIYPLPKGARPLVEKASEQPIDVVQQIGARFVGIHNFVSGFSWAPDSKKVAFIDCISDWVEKGTDSGGGSIGEAVNNKCSIAVIGIDGTATLFPLPPDLALVGFSSAENAHLSWNGDSVVLTGPAAMTFRVP